MTRKSLVVLGVVAAALVLLGFIFSKQQAPSDRLSAEMEAMFPGLEERLAEVRRLVVTGAGNDVVIEVENRDGAWRALHRGGYAVEFQRVREALASLAEARLREAKTANPGYYPRLGVDDVAAAASEGRLVTVTLESGDEYRVIVGKKAEGWKAHYARLPDAEQSWVLDRQIELETDPVRWLDVDVIDIALERVRSVVHVAPDGDTLRIWKDRPGDEHFQVEGIPEGHELTYPAVPEVVADVIDGLRMEDVLPRGDFVFPEGATYTSRFETFDGLVIDSRIAEKDGQYHVALDASFDAALRPAESAGSQPDAGDSGTAETGGETTPAPEASAEIVDAESESGTRESADTTDSAESEAALPSEDAVRAEAEALQKKLSGWVYSIAEYRYKGFTKRLSEIVREIEPEQENAGDEGADAAAEPG